ncbi:activated RNA polymerase II transcriptional coactivator p15 [Ischnura elegans]|uniref:activated RNA polymerase II transcriptional coactivator p15 n=1 Tax=Ischnura elegans TaxID=197161 RepID=UPI001ED87873|nr:activated RNA polymerase II transcriptional coactivator p15 [Ischnura elegans]
MPKNKDKKKVSESESSDSDSSVEEKPAPSKKAKTSNLEKDENGDYSWHLEKMKYAKVRTFQGKVYVDIREYYQSDGKMKPGKKGISLSVDQWRRIKELMPEIDEAIKEM